MEAGTAAAVTTGGIVTPLGWKAANVRAALARPTVEPLLDLEQQWFAYRDYLNGGHPGKSDEEMDPMFARLNKMEERIFLTPAQTIQGATIKLRVWADVFSEFYDSCYVSEWWRGDLTSMHASYKGFAGVMCDLERLAGESGS